MARTLALPHAALALLAACSGGTGTPAPDDPSQQVATTPVEAFFRYGPVPMGATRSAVRERLGEPDSTVRRVLPNPHDASVIDTLFTLHYRGLAVEIYRASFDGRELLSALAISADRWLRPESPLRLGMSREDVRLALGQADREEDGDLFYTCTSCTLGGQDALELRMDGNRLRHIRVLYWID